MKCGDLRVDVFACAFKDQCSGLPLLQVDGLPLRLDLSQGLRHSFRSIDELVGDAFAGQEELVSVFDA